MVTIIDYGIGNLRSIEKAFEQVGADVLRTDDPGAIAEATHLVLPGVGAFAACIGEIRARGLEGPIHDAIDRGVPFLGVCVGMQLLFDVGEEHGSYDGLGILPGRVVHFNEAPNGADGSAVASTIASLKVPHMGWNTLAPTRSSPLLRDVEPGAYVYFVHSYHALPGAEHDVLAHTTYGHDFPAIVQRDHVFGVQFHPEKSQDVGLKLLANFAAL